ncbi:MAG: phage tail family protein [Coriobacteriia bacterium]|nr:phage tail family protein [Coriobacteriia bacterium]
MLFDEKIYDEIFETFTGDAFEPDDPNLPDPDLDLGPVPDDDSGATGKGQTPPPVIEPNENLIEIEISAEGRTTPLRISSEAHELNVLLGHEGLSSAFSEIAHFDHAILDGGSVGGLRAATRRITLDFVAVGKSHHEVASLFPMGQKETIKVSRGNVTRIIEGYRDGAVELHAASALATPVMTVSFLCPSPFFRSEQSVTMPLNGAFGGLEYPIEPQGYPLQYGTIDESGLSTVLNSGDYPAPFVLEMTSAVSGTLGLLINGKELVRIVGVASGERIVFDTATKMLSIGDQKRLSALDGTFPSLPVGTSTVELTGLAGNPTLSFSELFEGV